MLCRAFLRSSAPALCTLLHPLRGRAAAAALPHRAFASTAAAAATAGSRAEGGDHMREGLGLPASAHSFTLPGPFRLEYGGELPSLTLGYNTYGTLAPDGRNAVIIGHSLTSNSAVHEWWGALLGPGPAFMLDTERYFVVCVNYLGSVYGSSGPLTPRAAAGPAPPFSGHFPVVTLRDNVAAQRALLAALGVKQVALAMGGSLGGMLALEWAAAAGPQGVRALCVVGSCGRHPDWAIGFGEAGRQAIYADPAWRGGHYAAEGTPPPLGGMAVARRLAMLSYRTPQSLSAKFARAEVAGGRSSGSGSGGGSSSGGALDAAGAGAAGAPPPMYEVERYLNYQGEKFMKRFDPLAYVRLSQLLDSHDLGRGRGGAARGDYRAVLATLQQRALIFELSQEMAALMPRADLHTISSPHGHDSFLIEIQALNDACVAWRDGAMARGEAETAAAAAAAAAAGGGDADSNVALLVHAKWRVGYLSLEKDFTFRDAKALAMFQMRLADVLLQVRRCGGSPVTVSGSASCSVALGRLEVDLAMSVDAVAAELQLGGKWN